MDRMRERGTSMKWMSSGLLLCFLAVESALAAPEAPQAPKPAAVRDPALIDAQVYVKLVQEYQGKPLLVTFWATWCEPWRDEYPMLDELAKQYAPHVPIVVCVNRD